MSPTVWRQVPLVVGEPRPPIVITLPTQDATDAPAGRGPDDVMIVRHEDDPWWSLKFIWSEEEGAWFSVPFNDFNTDDAWALDWSRHDMADLGSHWRRPIGGVGWYRAGWTASLQNDVVSGDATIRITSATGSIGSVPGAGQILIRDRIVTWTGKANAAGNSVDLTGCTWSGANGTTYKGLYTPVIPYSASLPGGGDPGGYGTNPRAMEFVGELRAAGFNWQEKWNGVLNGSFNHAGPDGDALTVAMFFIHIDPADDLGAQANFPNIFSDPTNFMLGPGVLAVGTTLHKSGGDGSGLRDNERGFTERLIDWTDCPLAFTKRISKPIVYATMGTAAVNGVITPKGVFDNGEAYQLTHWMRARTDAI